MFTVRYLNWCTVIWNIFIQERCFIGSSSYAKKHFRQLLYNTLLHWRIILGAFFMLEFHKFIAKFIPQVFACSCWYVFSVIFCIISNVRVLSTEKTCVLILCLKLLYTHIVQFWRILSSPSGTWQILMKREFSRTTSDAYLGPCQTPMMEFFCKND